MELIHVNPRTLNANPWNTNVVTPADQAKIEASLKRNGWVKPGLVREIEGGALQILGGEHRVLAAIALEHPTVPMINLGPISDVKAKEIGLIDNARYGADDALGLAELLAEIGDQHEIASFLPYGDDELASLFSNVAIDLDTLGLGEPNEDKVEKTPRPPKTHSVMRFKVPLEDLDRVSDLIERVKREQGFTAADSLTNAGDALVWVICDYLSRPVA